MATRTSEATSDSYAPFDIDLRNSDVKIALSKQMEREV